MSCDCPLSSALLPYLTGEGGSPLKVAVSVTPSDEVVALRSQVAELQAELQKQEILDNFFGDGGNGVKPGQIGDLGGISSGAGMMLVLK